MHEVPKAKNVNNSLQNCFINAPRRLAYLIKELYTRFKNFHGRPGELDTQPAGVCPEVSAHLGPWMSFNLRKLEFCVVWVHLTDLLPCRSSQHLNKWDGET